VALEVEADGRKVFYTGDLRAHGRKFKTFEHLVAHPPRDVSALLIEGSTIGRAEGRYLTEESVERALLDVLKKTDGLVMLFCSSQNLDRLVSASRAARHAKRTLVIDLCTAFVLNALAKLSPRIPQYDREGVRVKFYLYQQKLLAAAGRKDFDLAVRRSGHGIKAEEIAANPGGFLMLGRANSILPRLLKRLAANDGLRGLRMIWSMWEGYLERDSMLQTLCETHGIELLRIHTSGHAGVADLQRLAAAINPRMIVPIHTFHPGRYRELFGDRVRMLSDGESLGL